MFADFDSDKNNDDFLDEFRQKLNNEPEESFEERKNEISRSKNVFIGTVSGIAMAAVVGWLVLSPRYASENNTDIPVIRRPQVAVKVQPAEPGGMEIQNQDKSVYDIIEKKEVEKVVENLLPPPEEPHMPVVSSAVEDTSVLAKAEEIIKSEEAKTETQNVEKAPEAKTETQNIEKAPEAKITTTNKPAKQEAATVVAAPEINKKAEVTTNEAKVEENKVVVPETKNSKKIKEALAYQTANPAEIRKEVKTSIVAGPWQVQLISSTNRQAVDTAWAGLVKKYPMLEGQPQEIETAYLGDKGTFYRLKAGAFSERAGADRLCNDIKVLGGTCIVKKK